MIKSITQLKELEQQIISFSQSNNEILALLRYGSKLNNFDLLSDLDFYIITNNIQSVQIELEQLNPLMKLDFSDRTVMYYTDKFRNIRKIDIIFSNHIEKYRKYIKQSDNLTNAVIIDKIGITKNFNFHVDYNISNMIKYHINRFVEAFDNCSIANQSSDRYRFLFHQTIALQHLYTLEYMIGGYFDFNYLPKQFTNQIGKDKIEFLMNKFDPNSELKIGRLTRNELFEKFKFTMKKLSKKYPKLENKKIIEFLEKIIERDWIWNIRDIADINPDKLNDNILIRSSALSFYNNENIFRKFMNNYNINSIIDLRHEEEINKYPYKKLSIPYYNIPIGAKHIHPHELKYTEIGIDPFFYEYFPRHYHSEIFLIFKKIIEAPKPIVLHCYAGKDRTGIIVAMIQKLIGLNDEEIIMDYLSSRSDTKKEKIKVTLKLIEEKDGITNYLKLIGLTTDDIRKLISLFKK